jgi:hypothetical protein
MGILDIFSKRQKALRGELPDVSRPEIDAQLFNTAPDRLAVPEIA